MNMKESELLVAVTKSISNSEDLLSDADLLRENERFARAYTLYQLAIEEAGKAMDIYGSIILGSLNDKQGQKILRDNFKNHIEKAQRARMLSILFALHLTKTDKVNGEKLLLWTVRELTEAKILNEYKNYSLYTSFIENEYKCPKEIITKDRVNYIEVMARNRVMLVKGFVELSSKHFEEIKAYAAQNKTTSQKGNEEMRRLVEENFSNELLDKILPMLKKVNLNE